ncbi:MAG: ECF transporter S component [Clostridia bacterium]
MNQSTKRMVAIALFGALATVLMWFQFPLLPQVPFMSYDPSDVSVLIGTFSMGPVAGFFITTVKNVLYFITRGRSGLIGSFMNWTTTLAFIMTAGVIYRSMANRRWGALLGMLAGTLVLVTVGVVLNIYVALPIWGIPAGEVRGLITSAVIPFNVLRGLISTAVTFILAPRALKLIRGLDV